MFKGRTPTKEEREHMNAICNLGCIICLEWLGIYTPASIHHVDGRTKPGTHLKTIPLCYPHHQLRDNRKPPLWISRHGNGKAAFEAAYATESELLDMVSMHLERVERLSV